MGEYLKNEEEGRSRDYDFSGLESRSNVHVLFFFFLIFFSVLDATKSN